MFSQLGDRILFSEIRSIVNCLKYILRKLKILETAVMEMYEDGPFKENIYNYD